MGGGGHQVIVPPQPQFQCNLKKNHLEERLLEQAQARASYTPLFGGPWKNPKACTPHARRVRCSLLVLVLVLGARALC